MILYNSANYLSAESHRVIGEFWGVNSPITGPILEGSRGKDIDKETPISARPDVARFGATRTAVPTLPSRAHPQDYGRRTTLSNN